MFRHSPTDDARPCPQMHTLVSQLSDGTLKGLRRWYAEQHTARCARCSHALESLVETEARLRIHGAAQDESAGNPPATEPLSPEARARLQAALDTVDSASAAPGLERG
jgi:hypothetical protein